MTPEDYLKNNVSIRELVVLFDEAEHYRLSGYLSEDSYLRYSCEFIYGDSRIDRLLMLMSEIYRQVALLGVESLRQVSSKWRINP